MENNNKKKPLLFTIVTFFFFLCFYSLSLSFSNHLFNHFLNQIFARTIHLGQCILNGIYNVSFILIVIHTHTRPIVVLFLNRSLVCVFFSNCPNKKKNKLLNHLLPSIYRFNNLFFVSSFFSRLDFDFFFC